jgi:hydrogenase expression/formation protein HypC
MCLGLPGQVIAVRGNVAEVDFWGQREEIRLDELTEPVTPGDYIITHCGCAVRKIAVEDVADTMVMYESVLAECV